MNTRKYVFHKDRGLFWRIACLFVLCLASSSIYAQKINITGNVKDNLGEALIGANVVEKNTTNGMMTDVDGNFSLSIDENAILQVSFIGYLPQDISIKGKKEFFITLKEDSKALDEVVVVGYGTTVKKDLTTAVVSVSNKDFIQGAVNNAMQMIDGKVAGLSLSNDGAADPNKSSDVQVRGASSMKAGNTPLIVIDGMPGGDLRTISQQDIESITVLKDGSAAAIYGSRAANGVILVQTKQGKSGKVSITYDGYVEHDFVAKRPDVLSAEEFLAKGRARDMGSRTDWYDELLNKSNVGQNHNLALSGGSDNTVFRLSTNYRTKEGLDIVSDREEYGLRASFKQKTLENILEVGGNITYRVAEETRPGKGDTPNSEDNGYGAFKQAVQLNPTIDVNEIDYFTGLYDIYNPVKNLTERDFNVTRNYTTIDFNVKLNLTEDLNTEVKLARQARGYKTRDFYKSTHRQSIKDGYKGKAKLEQEDLIDWTLEWMGNYQFKVDKHDFKLMGGYSYQEFNMEKFWAENMDFPNDGLKWNNLGAGTWNSGSLGRLGMGSEKSKEKTVAFLGRVNYNYDDLFLVTASLRYEGNSKFGPENKWGYFPAASAAWRFSRLPVLQEADFIDDMKLRFSYGQTGRSGFDRYIAMSKYKGEGYAYIDGRWIKTYGPGNNENKTLQWEKQISYNLGIDYTMFNSRLSGSIDGFVRQGKDVIGDYRVPVPPYIYTSMQTNVGTTRDIGVELQLNLQAVKTKDFSYTTNVTLAFIKSTIKEFSKGALTKSYENGKDLPSPGNPGYAQRLEAGGEISAFYGYRYAGVDDNGGFLVRENGDKKGNIIPISVATGKDKTSLGSSGTPKWELAWGHSFSYKEFDLSLFFRGKFDYDIYNTYQMYYGLVSQPEVNLLHSAYKENAHIKGEKIVSDYFLENGNYIKLDNITVGYTPKLKTKWISNLRVYGSMRNVFTITKYTGLDPTAVQTSGMWAGVSSLDVYPVARNVSFGIQISY